MKNLYLKTAILFSLFAASMHAQVGIGTAAPDAQFDVRATSQATPSNTDGMLIPKIDAFPAINPTAAQQGMLIYLTTATPFLSTTRQPGFYYWNNPSFDWIGISSVANGDHDWYEEGATTAPDAITDDMFHIGNVAVGKLTADYPLDVMSVASDKSINNVLDNSTSGFEKIGISNLVSGSSSDIHYGIKNTIMNPSDGTHIGIRTDITGFGTGTHIGTFNDLPYGTGSLWGSYNRITNSENGLHYGTFNELSGDGGTQVGVRNLISGNASIVDRGVENVLSGEGTASKMGVYNDIGNYGPNSHYGVYSWLHNTGNGDQFGSYNEIANTGTGQHYGTYNILNGNIPAPGKQYGTLNTLSNAGNNLHFGVHNWLDGSGTGRHYGVYNYITGNGSGEQCGNHNYIINSADGIHYGTYNFVAGGGSNSHFGTFNDLSGSGTGSQVGTFNFIENDANDKHYGSLSSLYGTGSGDKYGYHSWISPWAGGTHYGVYSEVLKPGPTNFAGYFLGNVGIGTSAIDIYTLPSFRGVNGEVMQTNGAGVVSWVNPNAFAWDLNGNPATATNFIGTINNMAFRMYANNVERMRINPVDGDVVVGATASPYPRDTFSSVATATLSFANSGYSAQNGSGVWGEIGQRRNQQRQSAFVCNRATRSLV